MILVHEFIPDLIVEVTNACNRSCAGCYAPNVKTGSRQSDVTSSAVINLTVADLIHNWRFGDSLRVVSVRGGEPSLNPELVQILNFLSGVAVTVYLETNGDWIDVDNSLVMALVNSNVTVKLSVDSMHRSTESIVKRRISKLESAGVTVAVAVTEATDEGFQAAEKLLPVNFAGNVIRQKKAISLEGLVTPTVGVISSRGLFKSSLTSKLRAVGEIR